MSLELVDITYYIIFLTYLSRSEKFCRFCQPITHLCDVCDVRLQTIWALGSMTGSESLALPRPPGPPALAITDRLACCSYCHVRHEVNATRIFTLLHFLISRTRSLNASSTLIRSFAEVSTNSQPKCLARSRPSNKQLQLQSHEAFPSGENVSPYHPC